MIKNLEKDVLHFLNNSCSKGHVLLGLSGGPDSMALFHLLLISQRPFSVAHIDHGWREESRREAEILESLCDRYQIPFYLRRLKNVENQKNLEDVCRKERVNFFREIVSKQEMEGVLLAHHADDQAETILKRVFEGASLQKLKGLTEVTEIQGLKVFRPLLKFSKKALIEWLEQRDISYFLDSTNEDTRFLRSKIRKDILPLLMDEFGKEVSKSLCRIGKNALELSLFMEELLFPYRKAVKIAEGRICIDFEKNPPNSLFLWKAVIRDFFNSFDLTFSDAVLETIVFHLQKRSSHVNIRVAKRLVRIHKSLLSLSQVDEFK